MKCNSAFENMEKAISYANENANENVKFYLSVDRKSFIGDGKFDISIIVDNNLCESEKIEVFEAYSAEELKKFLKCTKNIVAADNDFNHEIGLVND